MIRILHVFSVLDAGGMENYVMNLYRQLDREQLQFDFLVHHQRRGFFEDEIEAMGGRVYHFSVLDDYNVFRYCHELNRFFGEHREYRIVHGHLSSTSIFYLGLARMHGIPWRIAHSHIADYPRTIKGLVKHICTRTTKWPANLYMACSDLAGKYMFGKTPFVVLPNGIDTKRFSFDPQIRDAVRKELQVEDAFVVGHVGRFHVQKNHMYLLRIFKELLQQRPEAKLLLLGDGELREQIQKTIENMGLGQFVILAGVRKDCERYYQAMDAFVLPSISEGLPVAGIEAQYSGLPCFFSDNISREAAITAGVKFFGIQKENISQWCEGLQSVAVADRGGLVEVTTDAFDIESAARNIRLLYEELWEK